MSGYTSLLPWECGYNSSYFTSTVVRKLCLLSLHLHYTYLAESCYPGKDLSLENRNNPEHSKHMFFGYNFSACTLIYSLHCDSIHTVHSVNQGNFTVFKSSTCFNFCVYSPSFWKPLHILIICITCTFFLIIQSSSKAFCYLCVP